MFSQSYALALDWILDTASKGFWLTEMHFFLIGKLRCTGCQQWGHKIKNLPFSTFRLNLSVYTPYNAWNEYTYAVIKGFSNWISSIIAINDNNLSSQNGSIAIGFVQDSLLGTYILSSSNFTKILKTAHFTNLNIDKKIRIILSLRN